MFIENCNSVILITTEAQAISQNPNTLARYVYLNEEEVEKVKEIAAVICDATITPNMTFVPVFVRVKLDGARGLKLTEKVQHFCTNAGGDAFLFLSPEGIHR